MFNDNQEVEYFIVNKNCPADCSAFLRLGFDYMKEVAADYPIETHDKFLASILNKQGQANRWLILLKDQNIPVGFVHAKIDDDERIGWGYILEFYIAPPHRRKGLGTNLFSYIKHQFIDCGVKNVWLSADRIYGEPFWFSKGFVDTGETENNQKVLKISL